MAIGEHTVRLKGSYGIDPHLEPDFPSQPFAPHTPVTELIQRVSAQFPGQSLKLLRLRIETSGILTPLCRAMIKVAAKSVSEGGIAVPLKENERLGPWRRTPREREALHPLKDLADDGPLLNEAQAILLVRSLSESVETGEKRYESDRKVGALLLSAKGEILYSARNSNSVNRTLHAEVNLLQGYFSETGRPLPKAATLLVSLKPCKMCAAMIVKMSEDIRNLKILYLEDDPGPKARDTALDELSKTNPELQRKI